MNEKKSRGHLREMMTRMAAHVTFDDAVEGIPFEKTGLTVPGLEHSLWSLVEHIRIVNQDIIDWVEGENYRSKPFPSGYWPESREAPREDAWRTSLSEAKAGNALVAAWATDEGLDLTAPLTRNESHSVLREILLVIAHNGYHIGQIVDLRALLGIPAKDR